MILDEPIADDYAETACASLDIRRKQEPRKQKEEIVSLIVHAAAALPTLYN